MRRVAFLFLIRNHFKRFEQIVTRVFFFAFQVVQKKEKMNKGFSLQLKDKKVPTFEQEDALYAGETMLVRQAVIESCI